MNSLVFIVSRSLKNSFWEILRKPAKLTMYIIFIILIVATLLIAHFTQQESTVPTDPVWLKLIMFSLFTMFVVIGIIKSLSNGDTIFDMSDVNLLFVSPVDSRQILLYGIVRTAKMALYAGVFILFQANSLRGFGFGFNGLLMILLGFVLTVCLMQIISLIIYSHTNSRPRRKMVVRVLAVLAFLPLVACFGLRYLEFGAVLPALEAALRSEFFAWTPVSGWAAEGTLAFLSGNTSRFLLFYGIHIGLAVLLVAYILRSNPDYYEDVSLASETAFERKRNLAEGHLDQAVPTSTRKVKVKHTGLSGSGANAIFGKHFRESFRANRLGFWDFASLVVAAIVIIFALALPDVGLLLPLQILMWMQIFLIGTGRGLKELYSHYIYLIPEPSFAKIVWSNVEIVVKVLGESMLMFITAGLIMGETPLTLAAVIAVFVMFSLLLLGVNYISLRFTGADISTGMLMMLYAFAVMLIMLPGLVVGIALAISLENDLVGLCVIAVWELLAALVCFALSRGILHLCDMPVVKMK
jgi:hypothetical protein